MTMALRGSFALAVLLLLAACGRAADHTVQEPATPTAGANAPTAGTPACTKDIRVIPGQVDGAAGHRFLVLVFNNVSMKTCRMVGYPKVDLVDDEEHVVQHVRHTLRGQAGLPPNVKAPRPVILRGGQSASAIVEASAMPEGNGPECTYYSLMVTPPDEVAAVPAGPATMPNCDIQVHPVVPGDLRNR